MHKIIGVVVLMVLIVSFTQAEAQAQTRNKSQVRSDQERRTDIYIVAGLASFGFDGQVNGQNIPNSNVFQFGGGVDSDVYKGFSIGGEVAQTTGIKILGVSTNVRTTTLSANGSYHFLKGVRASRLDPFVTAGYSRHMFSNGLLNVPDANTPNFGGGMNFWVSKKFGVRLDLREHVGDGGHFGLRGGIVFGL